LSSWFMQDTNRLAAGAMRPGVGAGAGWRVATAADFNRDGSADVLWQHTSGRMSIWLFQGTTFLGHQPVRTNQAPSGWKVVGAGDFDTNNSPDIVLQHTSGKLSVWYHDGTSYLGAAPLRKGKVVPVPWRIVGVGDIDGDG